jgi:transcriptional regulator with XRE-family HTH domain
MDRAAKSIDSINLTVGHRIRLKRKLSGMSQSVLGQKIGVSRIRIGKYEAGTSEVPASILFRLSRIFKVDLCYFFDNDQDIPGLENLADLDPALSNEAISLIKDFAALGDSEVQKSFAAILERAAELQLEKNTLPLDKIKKS